MREECRNHLQRLLVAPLRHVWSSVIIVLRGRGIEHRKSFVPSFLPSFLPDCAVFGGSHRQERQAVDAELAPVLQLHTGMDTE